MIVDAQRFDPMQSRAVLQDTPAKALFILVLGLLGTFGLWLQTDGASVPTAMVLDFLEASGNNSRLLAIPILSIISLVFASIGMVFSLKSRWLQRLRMMHGFVAVLSLVCCGLWIFFGSGILRFTSFGFYFQLIGGVFALIVVLLSEEPSEDDRGESVVDARGDVTTVSETHASTAGLEVATVVISMPGGNNSDSV